jgi:hypothetical protein
MALMEKMDKEKIKAIGLGDLVITATLAHDNYVRRVVAMSDPDHPYPTDDKEKREQEIYDSLVQPFVDELNEREKKYLKPKNDASGYMD